MKSRITVLLVTIVLILWADRVPEIGERIPFVLLLMWSGSATVAAMVFATGSGKPSTGCDPIRGDRAQMWVTQMRRIGLLLLPLTPVPLLEIRHSGYDAALWLMNGVLLVSFCSGPFWWSLTGRILGAVVLNVVSLSLLWHVAAWGLFQRIVRTEGAKPVPTVDTTSTLHAFLDPEYRAWFYLLCGGALLLYCPIMLWLGYRRFLAREDAPQEGGSPRLPGVAARDRLT